jgi:ABC-type Fe3+ transport system permease subunit
MIKSLIMGAIPLAIVLYLIAFHAVAILTIALVLTFLLMSFLIGTTFREEFGDLRDKEKY